MQVHPDRRSAELGGEPLELTPKEFDLLHLLLSHPQRVYMREELLEQVWDMDYAGERAPWIFISSGCAKSWASPTRISCKPSTV